MFSDINLKVIEISQRNYYKEPGDDSVKLNIQNKRYIKALIAGFKIGMTILQTKKTYIFHIGKRYINYDPPIEIRGEDTKYREHLIKKYKAVQEALLRRKCIYVRAFCGILQNEENDNIDYSVIKFRQCYWDKVYKILPADNCAGVHIRRTDHACAIEKSHTAAFAQMIDKVLKEHPDMKFFLATDDKVDNCAEMQSGIIELLCLSQCCFILGSYTSSYSFFAASYGKKELIACTEDEGFVMDTGIR